MQSLFIVHLDSTATSVHIIQKETIFLREGSFLLQFAEHLQNHLKPVINLYRDKTIQTIIRDFHKDPRKRGLLSL